MFAPEIKLLSKLPANEIIPAAWYDQAYYAGPPKSNWEKPYTWENFLPTFAAWAQFLLCAFPETKSFLDVGCAQGFISQAILQTVAFNKKPKVEIEGFDISSYAIENAHPKVKNFLQCASTDTFIFSRNYDVMLCLDMAEHLTETQIETFLFRSRPFINDCAFFVIDLGLNTKEPTHITIQSREWWNKKFLDAGWILDAEMKQFQSIAAADKFIASAKAEVFIFSSGNNRFV